MNSTLRFASPLLLLFVACEGGDVLSGRHDAAIGANPRVEPVATADAQEASPPPELGPILRTVSRRNPFGNLDEPLNLIADGDFEFTGRSGQQPWYQFSRGGQELVTFETGGLCRSGVRCGKLGSGQTLIGFVASPKTGSISLRVWVRPSTKDCSGVSVGLADLASRIQSIGIEATGGRESDGWCRFEGRVPSYPDGAPYVFVDASLGVTALVDDVVVRPALPDAQPEGIRSKPSLEFRALDRETNARLASMADWLRSRRRFASTPRTRGER